MTYRHIDFLAREIDMMHRRGNAQVNADMGLRKVTEAMHEPLCGEVR